MNVAEQLFAEADAEDAAHNPPLTKAQLMAPVPDAKLAAMGKGVLVRCEATIVEGQVSHTIPYLLITEDVDSLVFTSSAQLVTRMISTKPLTPDEQRLLQSLLAD